MFPIILAHGIARFDILVELQRERFNLPDDRFSDEFQYFKGIKTHLEANGFPNVYRPNEDFAGSVDKRARQLKDRVNEALAQTGAGKAHIIAHSMGGLDARRMIVDLEMADKIASLTTIGTPHFGTILADHVIANGGFVLMAFLKGIFKLDLNGFNDLTTAACEEFNRRAEEQEATNTVFYQTYSSSEEKDDVFELIVGCWEYIHSRAGRSDGLVPFTSQQWTDKLTAADGSQKPVAQKEFLLPADHLNQIGWWDLQEAVNLTAGGGLLAQKIHYEDRIKEIYLEIAADLGEKFN